MPCEIHTFVLDPLDTNGYVICCDDDVWVIDPPWPSKKLENFLRSLQAPPSRILFTHGHGDHIAGAEAIKSAFPQAKLCCPEAEAAMLTDPWLNRSALFGVRLTAPAAEELLRPGQTLHCGATQWQLFDTSGHTPGSLSYYCPQAAAVFTGDALFAGSIGRTDLPGGSTETLLKNIHQNLLSLPDETTVFPGHGPSTTIGQERRCNPYLTGRFTLMDSSD